jgi:nitroreductase
VTPDQVRQVVAAAVRAPSVHNTQPWSFDVESDVVGVRADRSRQLIAQDPEGRELLLSCGAAAFHAWLAVRGLGRSADLAWLPEPGDADLVARVTAGGREAPDDSVRRLLAAVPLRHTDRSAFAAEPVSDEVVGTLRAAAEREGAWLLAAVGPDQEVLVDVLASRADALLQSDDAVRHELAGLVSPRGVPAEGLPYGALPEHGWGRGSSLPLRDFSPAATSGPIVTEPPVAEHPLLLVLGTPDDTPADWLRAGAALARVLLLATAEGLVANPQTAVLEVPALRARLREELGLAGRPQMLLRAGWPTGPGSPHTGRRDLADVLTERSST